MFRTRIHSRSAGGQGRRRGPSTRTRSLQRPSLTRRVQRVELKRLEHERQRQIHRKNFEDQMRALEAKQLREEHELLVVNASDAASHIAVSAPTTPPRASPEDSAYGRLAFEHSAFTQAASKANKRKSVTYAPSLVQDAAPGYGGSLHPHSFARPMGAKSMPASRRTSASSQELDELSDLTLRALALNDRSGTPVSSGNYTVLRNGRGEEAVLRSEPQSIDAGLMLDDELDKEMHSTNTTLIFILSFNVSLQMPCATSLSRRRMTSSPSLAPSRTLAA